jgi:DNA-binding NarL/FixJ family response regulator
LTSLLTKRQLEFLAYSAQGLQNPEIAEQCFISLSAVKDGLEKARERLGARTTTQAVAMAVSLELIVFDVNTATFAVASTLIR